MELGDFVCMDNVVSFFLSVKIALCNIFVTIKHLERLKENAFRKKNNLLTCYVYCKYKTMYVALYLM